MATRAVKKAPRHVGVRYIVNARGKRTEAVLPIAAYTRLVEQAEELADIRAFDKAANDRDFIPWEQARRQLGV